MEVVLYGANLISCDTCYCLLAFSGIFSSKPVLIQSIHQILAPIQHFRYSLWEYGQFASFALFMPERLRTNEERQTWLQKPGGSYSVLSSVICFTLNEQICSKNKWDAAICHHNRIDYILWHNFISYLLPSSSSSSTPRKTLVFVQYLHLCVQCTVIH